MSRHVGVATCWALLIGGCADCRWRGRRVRERPRDHAAARAWRDGGLNNGSSAFSSMPTNRGTRIWTVFSARKLRSPSMIGPKVRVFKMAESPIVTAGRRW